MAAQNIHIHIKRLVFEFSYKVKCKSNDCGLGIYHRLIRIIKGCNCDIYSTTRKNFLYREKSTYRLYILMDVVYPKEAIQDHYYLLFLQIIVEHIQCKMLYKNYIYLGQHIRS